MSDKLTKPLTPQALSLTSRAKEVERLCNEIEMIAIRAGKDALPKAIKVGQLLTSIKLDIPHGGWPANGVQRDRRTFYTA